VTDSHCCAELTRRVEHECDLHPDPFECPDNLVYYSARLREYGLIIHDGGSAMISIGYCPWCGSELPASARDLWFDELARRGIDPDSDDMPEEFTDGRWLAAIDTEPPATETGGRVRSD